MKSQTLKLELFGIPSSDFTSFPRFTKQLVVSQYVAGMRDPADACIQVQRFRGSRGTDTYRGFYLMRTCYLCRIDSCWVMDMIMGSVEGEFVYIDME